MIEITEKPVSPELMVNKVKTDSSGCVVVYVGLIRGYSRDKRVLFVEYEDVKGTAEGELQQIAGEARQKWQLDNIAISHRIGKLKVGDINLVVAVASAHRKEALAACRYVINRFKQKLPTRKKEAYEDAGIRLEG